MTHLNTILAGVSLVLLTAAARGEVMFKSGPEQVTLVELYTSEGCSSCPPAEKLVSGLRDKRGLWREFVPVAFHVNYWDHLGWRDPLASKEFTNRQHAYAALWQAASVYTPGFVRNGAEWRPRGAIVENASRNAGELTAVWNETGNECRIVYRPAAGAGAGAAGERTATATAFDGYVALLGGGIVHDVRRGENAGRKLRQDFVALRLEKTALAKSAEGEWTAMVKLAPRQEIVAPERALAAWVTPNGELAPLQATGGWVAR